MVRVIKPFISVLLVLTFCISSWALVQNLEIEDDDRTAFHIDSFGYESGGHFQIELTDFTLMVAHGYEPPKDSKYKIAFVLQRSDSDAVLRIEDAMNHRENTCFHQGKEALPDHWVISLADRHDWKHFSFSKTVEAPGFYHLYFSNCEPNTQVTFNMRLTEYNVDPATGRVNYLSAGEASLPTWFFVICAMFVVEIALWSVYMRKHRSDVRTIHYLMTAVVGLKILSLFFEAFRYHTLQTSGTHDAWSIFYYIFTSLKGMLMFAVIVLIGTGWSYLKPFLTDRDKQVMLAVMVVQMMVNIAMVILDETAPGSAGFLTWRDMLHLLDIICCCVILLPIVWSIKHLREAANEDSKDGRGASRSIDRLKSFRTFYLVVVCYIYFTRIVVFLLSATLPFELTWLSTVFSELANLIFYAITGYLFRPKAQNPYFAIAQDDDDDGLPEPSQAEMAEL